MSDAAAREALSVASSILLAASETRAAQAPSQSVLDPPNRSAHIPPQLAPRVQRMPFALRICLLALELIALSVQALSHGHHVTRPARARRRPPPRHKLAEICLDGAAGLAVAARLGVGGVDEASAFVAGVLELEVGEAELFFEGTDGGFEVGFTLVEGVEGGGGGGGDGGDFLREGGGGGGEGVEVGEGGSEGGQGGGEVSGFGGFEAGEGAERGGDAGAGGGDGGGVFRWM